MGRDVGGIRIDKKGNAIKVNSNGVSHDTIRVSPKLSGISGQAKDFEVEVHTMDDLLTEEYHEKQDVLDVKSMNHDASLPEEKTLKPEGQKSDNNLSSPIKANVQTMEPLLHPSTLVIDKQISIETHPIGTEIVDVGGSCSSNTSDFHSSNIEEKSQPNSPQVSSKSLQPDMKHLDEDDNWSITSSIVASVQSTKGRTTIPIAPAFRCVERAEKRKEFYSKLEEKQQALEVEKIEYEARMKEKEKKAIKHLRKAMVFKAKPMPGFYLEGPPPKAKLNKPPPTRAKSPKLNRRKSCGDAASSSLEKKGVLTRAIHKDGGTTTTTIASPIKNKNQVSEKSGKDACKIKDHSKTMNETTTETTTSHTRAEQTTDITVNG